MRRGGSLIHIENWSDAYGWGKIPKLWLYDGNHGRMLLLSEFNFTQLSFQAMKIYMAILAFSRYRDHQLRPPGGLHWRTKHHIAYAVTRLYDKQLISFRPGELHCEHQFDCQQISGAQLWYTLAGTGGRKAGGQKCCCTSKACPKRRGHCGAGFGVLQVCRSLDTRPFLTLPCKSVTDV